MATTHEPTHLIEAELGDDPLAKAWEFYELNDYTIDDPIQLLQDPIVTLSVERGRRGSGWFSSDMTQLYNRAVLTQTSPTCIEISYCVDVRGQVLSDGDRAFWTQEIAALQEVLCEDAPLRDLVPQERERASARRAKSISSGWRFALAASVVILILAMIIKALIKPY
jgi:hypothetical protein